MKFGGTSVSGAERMLAVAAIVSESRARKPVVVCSALGGVTSLLASATRSALADDLETLERELADLQRRHRWSLSGAVEDPGRRHDLNLELDRAFDELRERLRSMRILGEGTARASDAVLALGELLASRLLVGVMRDRGLPARWVDPREVVVTDGVHGAAEPDLAATRSRASELLLPLLADGELPVLGGFVGATEQGETTTLGRGGSDTSAAVLGHALAADEIQVWTDVDGLMTADPRLVAGARTQPSATYAEAAELAFYGARVLHPASIAPAVAGEIPLRVLNSLRPAAAGTRVSGGPGPGRTGGLAAVASRGARGLLRIVSRRMRMEPAFLPDVMRALEREEIVPDLLVSSEVAVNAVVDEAVAVEGLARRLSAAAGVELERGRGLICVVGDGLAAESCRGAVLAALAAWHPDLVALGASRISAAAIVPETVLERAVAELHRRFFEAEECP